MLFLQVNFSEESLRENIGAFVNALLLAKPVGLKKSKWSASGAYVLIHKYFLLNIVPYEIIPLVYNKPMKLNIS